MLTELIYVLITALVCGILAGAIGARRHRAPFATFLGLTLGPLGVLLAFAVADGRPQCPACRTRVDPMAVICPECRSDLR